ncbi:dTMP kinase [candidate division WOR-3 bacterium]|nr:dTMP kinase [candidate division WOR-3 bacterium]
MKGLFITFEGIEGSGKSTQAERLYKWLTSQGYDCIFTKEPGGTDISKKISNILLDEKNDKLSKFTEFFLYLADRAQNVAEIIKPALLKHKIVIADRFSDATLAYQGGGRGIPVKLIKDMNAIATQGLIPDITILIDLPPEQGLSRIKRKDRIELESRDFHYRVRAKYLEIVRANPERVKMLDGALKPDKLEIRVKELVKPLLK